MYERDEKLYWIVRALVCVKINAPMICIDIVF